MKTQELMIGDWVSLSETINEIRQCKVVALDEYELCVCQPQDKSCDVVGYDMITPIPITAEILEKNGINPIQDCDDKEIGRTRYCIFAKWCGYTITKYDDVDSYSLGIGSMYFVHELQHALRLCGLTELADNFKI